MAAALYIHIPFCAGKCAYCDFVSFAGRRRDMARYLCALKKEICARAGDMAGQTITSVYIGGGTPTFIGADALCDIIDEVKGAYCLSPNCEISCEANPGTVAREGLEKMRASGINRLSLGVQAAQDELLKRIGRIHTFDIAVQAYNDARAAGFDNINLDFMYALPGQTVGMWRETLERAAELSPEHLSLYSLILEDGTRMKAAVDAGKLTLPDEDEEMAMLDATREVLARAGYQRYEISNYCRGGRECRHNILYWRNGQYLGLGCAAHSRVGDKRLFNDDTLEGYIARVDETGSGRADGIGLTNEDDAFDTIMLGTRMIRGVDLNEFSARHGQAVLERLLPDMKSLEKRGLASLSDGRFCLTERGLMLQNTVLVELMEAQEAR